MCFRFDRMKSGAAYPNSLFEGAVVESSFAFLQKRECIDRPVLLRFLFNAG